MTLPAQLVASVFFCSTEPFELAWPWSRRKHLRPSSPQHLIPVVLSDSLGGGGGGTRLIYLIPAVNRCLTTFKFLNLNLLKLGPRTIEGV